MKLFKHHIEEIIHQHILYLAYENHDIANRKIEVLEGLLYRIRGIRDYKDALIVISCYGEEINNVYLDWRVLKILWEVEQSIIKCSKTKRPLSVYFDKRFKI